MLHKIFLTPVSHPGGKHLLSIYLGILVYLPCSKAQNTRKKIKKMGRAFDGFVRPLPV